MNLKEFKTQIRKALETNDLFMDFGKYVHLLDLFFNCDNKAMEWTFIGLYCSKSRIQCGTFYLSSILYSIFFTLVKIYLLAIACSMFALWWKTHAQYIKKEMHVGTVVLPYYLRIAARTAIPLSTENALEYVLVLNFKFNILQLS